MKFRQTLNANQADREIVNEIWAMILTIFVSGFLVGLAIGAIFW